jgi:hypothetical protein
MPSKPIEIPCLRNGCPYTVVVHLEVFWDIDENRDYKLRYIRNAINTLKSAHENGNHAKPPTEESI